MSRAPFSFRLFPFLLAGALFAAPGCGTIEEGTEGESDTWTQPTDLPPEAPPMEPAPGTTELPPPVTPPELLLLQYRVDSLQGENRRLRQQVEAMAAELRTITARNADLEQRLIAATPRAAAAPPPSAQRTPAPERQAAPPPARPAPRKTATLPATADGTELYSDALATYRRRNFQEAADQFGALLKSGKAGALTPNCHYWLGESLYGLERYDQAIQHFQEVMDFAGSEKKDDAQMMIGNSYLGLGNTVAAKEAFATLIRVHPRSPFVRRAQEKMNSAE